jgi:hypothetical protein
LTTTRIRKPHLARVDRQGNGAKKNPWNPFCLVVFSCFVPLVVFFPCLFSFPSPKFYQLEGDDLQREWININ